MIHITLLAIIGWLFVACAWFGLVLCVIALCRLGSRADRQASDHWRTMEEDTQKGRD